MRKTPSTFIDLIGQRFGRLVVLERGASRYKDNTYWRCRCDCGKEKSINRGALRNGATQSCGCLQKERVRKVRFKDLTGQRFGKLLVIRENGYSDVKRKVIAWLCQCDCGNKATVNGIYLRKRETMSCGCYRIEMRRKKNKDNRCGYQPDRRRAMIKRICSRYFRPQRNRTRCIGVHLTKEEIEVIIFSPCHYCGDLGDKVFKDECRQRKYSDEKLYYNGIDRIDSSKEYTADNVVPCCWKCNRSKGESSQEEFRSHVIKIYNKFCLASIQNVV